MVIHMNIADILEIKTAVSLAELRRNPRKIVRIAKDHPVAVLSSKKPLFYLFSAETYETLIEFIEDTYLREIVKTR